MTELQKAVEAYRKAQDSVRAAPCQRSRDDAFQDLSAARERIIAAAISTADSMCQHGLTTCGLSR